MPGYARPDVYINEQLAQSSPSFFPGVTPAAFVGYCRQGPIVPVLVDSWAMFQRLYGGWTNTADDALALQVYQYFNNHGGICFVTRVLGTGAASAVFTFQDRLGSPANILVCTADNPGTWGNAVWVEIVDTGVTGRFNLNVRLGAATNAPIERFLDLSMNPADARNAVAVINANNTGSNYITVNTPVGWVYAPATGIPAASTAGSGGSPLTGGADSSAPPTTGASGQLMTGLGLLSAGPPSQVGLVINLVGVVDTITLNAALAYVQARQDSFLICDCPFGDTSAQAATFKATLTQSSYGAIYWPNVYIGDPSSNTPGSTKLVAASGSVMGQISNSDATRGTAKPPAGITTSLANVLALELPQPQLSDYDIVANAHINGLRYFQNIGYVIWGSDTLKSTQADSSISIRRTLMAIEQAIAVSTLFAVQEINDADLWYEVTQQVTSILQQLYQQGGLRGSTPADAYFVTCDGSNNTAQTIAAGEVHVTVGVSLQFPAKFIIINVGQFAGSTSILDSLA